MSWIWLWLNAVWGKINKTRLDPVAGYVVSVPVATIKPTITVVPTKIIATTKPTVVPAVTWGVARQIDEHTWTMKVGMDAKMATPNEILQALNDYRVRRGSQRLTVDQNLANYAQSRAEYLYSIKSTDGHKGFENFLDNENGYDKLGFTWLGENISYGYQLEGVHVIEWMYAGDKPHDDNQVNNRWNYVGIGVKGTATALIFGTGRR